eukprot:TRINITY_DN209_c0_g1_i2.p1 TRINITY_DN209_c0_g1~~TRINITY_DN209_c0_g1_i2.p1  ORF type:complete len:296 (-),score=12.15 TRINITY_DN209_c0_g1_i2:25-912(-)
MPPFGQAPICPRCKKRVYDAEKASGFPNYHSTCLKCKRCKKSLFTVESAPYDDGTGEDIYCHVCFTEVSHRYNYDPKVKGNCKSCGDKIWDKFVQVGGDKWHPEHFICSICSKDVQTKYHLHEGKLLCPQHFQAKSASMCPQCQAGIPAGTPYEQSAGEKYHPACLRAVEREGKLPVGALSGAAAWTGMLEKQGGSRPGLFHSSAFRPRRFALQGNQFHYYKITAADRVGKRRGAINLKNCQVKILESPPNQQSSMFHYLEITESGATRKKAVLLRSKTKATIIEVAAKLKQNSK